MQRGAAESSTRHSRANSTERWKEFVESVSYHELDEVLSIVGINAGHNPSVSHRRRLLIETHSGQIKNRQARANILAFDFEAYETAVEERRVQQRAREKEKAAELKRTAKQDAHRAARKDQLTKDVTALRQSYNSETKGKFASREWVMTELEKDGPNGGWHLPFKNKGLEIYLGEVLSCWASNIWYEYPTGFIDMSDTYGTKLLWEHVKVLEPLEQKADSRGCILLRTNSTSIVKLRKAKHCILEAILFATGART